MSFEYFIAKRYLKAKRKTGFISIITYVSIAGITIGVTALILVLSVMNGFEKEVRTRLISADAHLHVRKYFMKTIENPDEVIEKIKDIPHIIGLSPTIKHESFAKSETQNRPAFVRAIDTKTANDVIDIEKHMVFGELDFSPKEIDGKMIPGIVLGRHLADALLALNVGDRISLWTTPEGIFVQPNIKEFYVAGLVEFGYYEYDKILAYISIEDAQDLFTMQGVSTIEIKLDDYQLAREVGEEIKERLQYPYIYQTWFDQNKSLFSWMEVEKLLTFIILSLIIIVAAFNIVSSLVMVVMDKTREIGILKSMGATAKNIKRIFLFEGLLIGVTGTVLGNVIAYTIIFLQMQFNIIPLPQDVFLIDTFPVDLELFDFFAVSSISMFLCFISSVYPAYKASKLIPVEAIRYE